MEVGKAGSRVKNAAETFFSVKVSTEVNMKINVFTR